MAHNRSRLLALLHYQEYNCNIAAAYLLLKKKGKPKRKHRWWVHEILKKRHEQGAFDNLFVELEMDAEKFQQYMRLSRSQFADVLSLVEMDLVKYSTFREVISPKQRLAVCLRFLATGESFRSLAFSYRIGERTVSRIVSEVCKALWKQLAPRHMKFPTTNEEWRLIASNFEEKWQFPHCVGALDGKHVVLKWPDNSVSLYFNYKGTFSTGLLALVDANIQFIAIDVGAYGRNSDGGIFSNSNLGKGISVDIFNFPPAEPLPQADHLGPIPYVIVADEAFPLQNHIMRPFPSRGCPMEERSFNYRLSRARRIVENAFGLLAARWSVFFTKLAVGPETANDVIKAPYVLHNLLQSESTPAQLTALTQEDDLERCETLHDLRHFGHRATHNTMDARHALKEYFNRIAPLPWQEAHVRKGYFAS